jgi:hypothetical protein
MDIYTNRQEEDQSFLDTNDEFAKIHFDSLGKPYDSPPVQGAYMSRLYILRQLAKQQSYKNSNFAECGVFAGMSMYFVADFCNKNFIGIDSWEGVSEPGEFDTDFFKTKKLDIPLDYAQKSLEKYSHISLHKGWIPDVFKEIKDLEYSYVNIDVDLYEPTKNSIEYFWPKLINGGVLICDDYGSYNTIGARKAMIDFFGQDNILELPTGQAIIYK